MHTPSFGNASIRRLHTMAWTAKSPTVTGLRSFFPRVPSCMLVLKEAATLLHASAASATAKRAVSISFSVAILTVGQPPRIVLALAGSLTEARNAEPGRAFARRTAVATISLETGKPLPMSALAVKAASSLFSPTVSPSISLFSHNFSAPLPRHRVSAPLPRQRVFPRRVPLSDVNSSGASKPAEKILEPGEKPFLGWQSGHDFWLTTKTGQERA